MTSSGWLGEKYVHGWGNYGSRFVANVYINSITRNQTNVRVTGTVKFSSYANTSYSYYYYAINAFVNNVGIGQIKPYTGANNIRNKTWSKNFDVTVNCSQSATSVNLPIRFNDPTTGWVYETVTYPLYFNTYSKGPSEITSSASYTQYSTITTSCSGINWGQGYSSSSRKLTCVASYNAGTKTENITLGTWTDGATSKSVTKNDFVFPDNTTVTITWTASTNIGSAKATSKLNVVSTNPLPDLSNATVTATSTAPYCISASISGFDLKYNYMNPSVSLIIQYILDGQKVEKVLETKNISSSDTSATFNYSDSLNQPDPWNYVPDDETATIILRVTTSNGSSQKSISLYCQSSYNAYVIESIPDSEKVYTEKQTTNGYLQETNNLEHGEIAEIKQLLGETTQQTTSGKNVFNPKKVPTWVGADTTYNVLSDGTIEVSGKWFIGILVDVEPNTQYTLKSIATNVTGTYNYVKIYTRNQSYIADAKDTKTFNTSENSQIYIVLYSGVGSASNTVRYSNIQLEKGSSATDFEPYTAGASPTPTYPQPISVVTGENVVKIEGSDSSQEFEVNLGKNLFSGFATLATGSTFTDGTLTMAQSATNASNDFRVSPNTTYYLNFTAGAQTRIYIREYDGAGNMLVNTTKYVPYGFTTNANTALVRIYFSPSTSEAFPIIIKDIQLELGSTATDYAPYFTPIELAKIGNYQDRICKSEGKWYIEKKVGKVVLNGTQNIGTTTYASLYFVYTSQFSGMQYQAGAGLSDYFVYNTNSMTDNTQANNTLQDNQMALRGGASTDRLYIKASQFADAAAFKTWLGTHNTTVYYALATPTTTEITNEALIAQLNKIYTFYNGVSNIFIISNSGAQSDINFNVYSNWQKIIPATLSANGKNGTGQFKQVRRIGIK